MKNLITALCKVQSELKGAIKDTKNPFYKSSYADLESCWAVCRKPLSDNGLVIIQTMDSDGIGDYLITTLAHISGEITQSKLRLMPTKQDPQQQGSAITYARRYSLAAMVGIIQTDDDGESAMARPSLGIKPEQPTAEDGNIEPTIYKITFGKFIGRTLEEVGPDELRNYVDYLESKAKKDGKEIVGKVAEFIELAVDYIVSFERRPN